MIPPAFSRRSEFRRQQRRDPRRAFLILACLLVGLIGGGLWLVALIDGKL